MSRLGTYRNINVYDFNDLTDAISASIDDNIFAVYWYTGSWGKMLWKGEQVALVSSDRKGLHVVDFDEEVFQPKKKEPPAPPPCVKEISITSGSKEETEGPLYDNEWYKKTMGDLNEQWEKLYPTSAVG